MSKPVPARADCDPQYQWALTDIFPSDEAWQAQYDRTMAALDTLRGYEGHLADSADTLLRYLRLGDELGQALDALGN